MCVQMIRLLPLKRRVAVSMPILPIFKFRLGSIEETSKDNLINKPKNTVILGTTCLFHQDISVRFYL